MIRWTLVIRLFGAVALLMHDCTQKAEAMAVSTVTILLELGGCLYLAFLQ